MFHLPCSTLAHTGPGGDFSQAMAPALADVMPDGSTPAAPGDGSKGNGKGRCKAKAKAKVKGGGKGSDGGTTGTSEPNQGDGNTPEPVGETTPLQKAKALAKSVFLIIC